MRWFSLATIVFFVLFLTSTGYDQTTADNPGFPGIIDAKRFVSLSAAVDGILETVTLDRGDLVEEGQVVATLESSIERSTLEIAKARTEFVADMKQQKARLTLISATHEQDERLFKQGIISEQEIRETRAEKELAEAAVLRVEESMRLDRLELVRAAAILDLRTIRSPVSGVVVDRLLSPGELVNDNDSAILTVAQIDPLSVEVIVPVSLLKEIQVGQRAEIEPEPPFSKVVVANVKVVDRVVDAGSGTFRVRLELPNPDHRLPAGLKCTVRFQ
jgi:RND family efflux transporter MFP subunit